MLCHHIICKSIIHWAAWYNFWLLTELTPKGVVFHFVFFVKAMAIILHILSASWCRACLAAWLNCRRLTGMQHTQ